MAACQTSSHSILDSGTGTSQHFYLCRLVKLSSKFVMNFRLVDSNLDSGTGTSRTCGAFQFAVFGKQYLVLSHPDTLREALILRGKEFNGRIRSYRLMQLGEGRDFLTSDSSLSKLLRKAAHSAIKPFGSGRAKFAGLLDTAVEDLVRSMDRTNGQPFDPKEMISKATSLSVYLLVGIDTYSPSYRISVI